MCGQDFRRHFFYLGASHSDHPGDVRFPRFRWLLLIIHDKADILYTFQISTVTTNVTEIYFWCIFCVRRMDTGQSLPAEVVRTAVGELRQPNQDHGPRRILAEWTRLVRTHSQVQTGTHVSD